MQLHGCWVFAFLLFHSPATVVNCAWSEVDAGIEAIVRFVVLVYHDMPVKSGVPTVGEVIVMLGWGVLNWHSAIRSVPKVELL